ncbi:MAG: hypothetical protein ACYDEN_09230, partial [Acidimicrobiales bacterium]
MTTILDTPRTFRAPSERRPAGRRDHPDRAAGRAAERRAKVRAVSTSGGLAAQAAAARARREHVAPARATSGARSAGTRRVTTAGARPGAPKARRDAAAPE